MTIDQLRIPAAVAGGLALATWKYPRATRDVDIMVSLTAASLDELVRALVEKGMRLKGKGTPIDLGHTDIVQLSYEPPDAFVDVPLDILVAKSTYARQAVRRSIAITSEHLGFEIRVLACEDLVINKLLSGRVIDLADAAGLARANASSLDLAYLKEKADQLELSPQLDRVWAEACPDEPFS